MVGGRCRGLLSASRGRELGRGAEGCSRWSAMVVDLEEGHIDLAGETGVDQLGVRMSEREEVLAEGYSSRLASWLQYCSWASASYRLVWS